MATISIRFLIFSSLLLCCCLYTTVTCQGTFVKPSRNSDERIFEIQQKLLNVQSQILALNLNLKTDGNSDVLKGRLTSLEEAFQQLKEQMEEEGRESASTDAKYDHALATLTGYANNLEAELKVLKDKANPSKEPTEWERVAKAVSCAATVIPGPFGIFSHIPCFLSDMV